MKTFVSALAVLLALGCASTAGNSGTESGGGPVVAGLTVNPKNAPEYILLSSPNQIRPYDFSNSIGVRALHVRGTITNRGFYPAGEIEGNGTFCSDGKDWLSLSELKVYKADAGKTPSAPYILGCATNSGFQPASRAIVAQ